MSTIARSTVTVQQTRLAYADTFGDEHLRGRLLGLGPVLYRLDNFGGAVAENAISKKVAMAALDHLEMISPILHGDVVRFEGELINIGRSSLTLQVTGYRHDIATRKFVHALDAIMTAVALGDNNRPYRGLPELVDPSKGSRIRHLQEVAQRRKDLSMRLKQMEKSVDELPVISSDMLDDCTRSGEWSEQVPVQDTEVELAASFLPRHLNRNGSVFGGEVLSWMDKTALYCGRVFTGNSNMVTISADRVSFNLPITTDDVATMVARVCGVREHYVDVEVEIFLKKFASKERRKSHKGYFSVANLNTSEHAECVPRGLSASDGGQLNLRALLKAQHRRLIREEEGKLLQLKPLALSSISMSRL
ncbi:ATP-binding Cassette (ABC) superfamily [Phytophthora cinnamomi]|uniref:ATP-binding Cassette (ABC) superfamily n=1 Tax=Phytophthora cinnamomi TaxID=4785 RepID=UPI00355972AA|nr:ATP-binding Cassette (ABC) superfamily [Phytophthora cinnamomi]